MCAHEVAGRSHRRPQPPTDPELVRSGIERGCRPPVSFQGQPRSFANRRRRFRRAEEPRRRARHLLERRPHRRQVVPSGVGEPYAPWQTGETGPAPPGIQCLSCKISLLRPVRFSYHGRKGPLTGGSGDASRLHRVGKVGVGRLEDDCDTDLRAPRFPDVLIDDHAESSGAEVVSRGAHGG